MRQLNSQGAQRALTVGNATPQSTIYCLPPLERRQKTRHRCAGAQIDPDNIVEHMISSREGWRILCKYLTDTMRSKEEEERATQNEQ
ncbi:hypothetical protein NQ314_013782 [Rhamnusium bicolor]|uniref:Uncharacterized protein n=1 Tax=Rhamnusium bicolor TaxID=1586634 RepID=A0AAV8X4Z2_9CUCU|nr:hypothetical protein NQ314_013782 [Rhamnusium bicolor]